MTAVSTSAPRTTPARRGRAPWTVHVAATLVTVGNAMTCVGAGYFAFHDDPTRPASAPLPGSWQAVSLMLLIVAYAITAIATVPGLYRRSRLAWGVALGVVSTQFLFGALKYLGLGESAAALFVGVDVVVAACLLAAPTRRYVGAA
jgi:hypothetical protein